MSVLIFCLVWWWWWCCYLAIRQHCGHEVTVSGGLVLPRYLQTALGCESQLHH